jgi:hypothetical protein
MITTSGRQGQVPGQWRQRATLALTTELCYKGFMNRGIRRFLITCLLLVALPIKGFAATSMLACGPNHHQMVGAVVQDDEPAGSAWHDHGDGVSHLHPGMQPLISDPEQSILSSDDAASATEFPHFSAKLECGTCAPCCASAVLTGDVSIPIAAPANSADFPNLATALRSAPVGRLDRPPRLILA